MLIRVKFKSSKLIVPMKMQLKYHEKASKRTRSKASLAKRQILASRKGNRCSSSKRRATRRMMSNQLP